MGSARLLLHHIRRFRCSSVASPFLTHCPISQSPAVSSGGRWSIPLNSSVLPLPIRFFSSKAPQKDLTLEEDAFLPERPIPELDLAKLGLDATGGVVNATEGNSLFDAPVNALISVLDGFHELTGLPWWTVIMISALGLRASLLPVLVLQLKKIGKLAELFPKLPPPFPPPFSGISFRQQLSLHRKKRRELNCPSLLWNFAYVTVQLPCFLLWIDSIRRMCLSAHPGFDSGGVLWFQNLTELPHGVCAPIFPVLVASLHYVNVQVSFHTLKVAEMPGILGLLAKYYRLYLEILSLPLLVIGFYIPQGSLVYWVTNSSLNLIQQLAIRNKNFREMLSLPNVDANMEKARKLRRGGHDSAIHHTPKDKLLIDSNSSLELQFNDDVDPMSPQMLLEVGLQDIAIGNLGRALESLMLATEKDPGLVKGLIAIGQIHFSKKSLVEAAQYFERAISLIKDEEDAGTLILALYGAGTSLAWQEGKSCKGMEYLRRITQLQEPTAPVDKACYYEGFVMLGRELFRHGQIAEACEYLRKAAAYDARFERYVKECEECLEESK